MSALAIVRGDDSVTIASDGAGYDGSTGNLMTHVSKVALMPECSCIFANRGVGGATAAMHNALRQLSAQGLGIATFDHVLVAFPQLAERLYEEHSANALAGGLPLAFSTHFSFMIGGYSEERERFESYTLRSRAYKVPDERGVISERPPFTLIPLPEIHLAPSPSLEAADRVGITRPQDLKQGYEIDGQAYALKAVAACRLDREADDAEGSVGIHFVGAFLQLTTVQRQTVFSQVVHRWPDPVGEPIDPTRGDLLPAYLAKDDLRS